MSASGRIPQFLAALIACWLIFIAVPLRAQSPSPPPWREGGTEVDVALVLAVDISFSMDMVEQTLQREGYVKAITSPQVLEAIRKGMIGKIAVTYLEWAGVASREVVADWTIIEDKASAERFADILRAAPIRRARRTSVSTAIDFSMERLRAADLRPLRRVIDVSGDGPNNEGRMVTLARDEALAAGVTINGLPVVLNRGYYSSFDIDGLDDYYADCVIGGPGAFMVVVKEQEQFADAIKTKILREVAAGSTNDVTARPAGRSDCLVGERLWRRDWERN